MERTTISIDAEAYERLSEHKREGESFSDVIKRLCGGARGKRSLGSGRTTQQI